MNKVKNILPEKVFIEDAERAGDEFHLKNEASKPKRKQKSKSRFLKALNIFGLIEKDMLIRIMPFVFFFAGLALLYIANSYYAEKTIREIDKASKEIKELRSEYISTKTELMNYSKQSKVASAVLPMGLKESRVAPKKIVVINQSGKKK